MSIQAISWYRQFGTAIFPGLGLWFEANEREKREERNRPYSRVTIPSDGRCDEDEPVEATPELRGGDGRR
jgi:hypothetical protein